MAGRKYFIIDLPCNGDRIWVFANPPIGDALAEIRVYATNFNSPEHIINLEESANSWVSRRDLTDENAEVPDEIKNVAREHYEGMIKRLFVRLFPKNKEMGIEGIIDVIKGYTRIGSQNNSDAAKEIARYINNLYKLDKRADDLIITKSSPKDHKSKRIREKTEYEIRTPEHAPALVLQLILQKAGTKEGQAQAIKNVIVMCFPQVGGKMNQGINDNIRELFAEVYAPQEKPVPGEVVIVAGSNVLDNLVYQR